MDESSIFTCPEDEGRSRRSHNPDLDSNLVPLAYREDHSAARSKHHDGSDLNHSSHRSRNNHDHRKRRRSWSRSDSDLSSRSGSPTSRTNPKLSSVLVKPSREHNVADEAEREAIIASQRDDKQVFDRNKRMFGMLMGTLKQFKVEETGRERVSMKRARVETKLDAKQEQELSPASRSDRFEEVQSTSVGSSSSTVEEIRQDTDELFKNWEKTHKNLCNFIQTETKPRIFWLPKIHNPETERKLKETRDYFSLCMAERIAKHNKDMKEATNSSTLVKHSRTSRQRSLKSPSPKSD